MNDDTRELRLRKACKDWDKYMDGKMGVDTYGVDCSCGCKYFFDLSGYYLSDWGICTNPESPRAGLLTWEHQGCPRKYYKE